MSSSDETQAAQSANHAPEQATLLDCFASLFSHRWSARLSYQIAASMLEARIAALERSATPQGSGIKEKEKV